jgi:hypothetical protein
VASRLFAVRWLLSFGLLLFCSQTAARSDAVSHKVRLAGSAGTLTVKGLILHYEEADNPLSSEDFPCRYFLDHATVESLKIGKGVLQLETPFAIDSFVPDGEGLNAGALLQIIKNACDTNYAEEKKVELRDGLLAALRAADEPDPFASIRGDFDLSAPDSHQWKTSFQVPGAEKCGLLKAPPATGSVPVWTLACAFRADADGYEGMVKSVQSALSLPYQPDERAVNMNQVFFADPAKPARRVFVAKINDDTIRIAVVAVPPTAAPAGFNSALFPASPTAPPAELTISQEIEAVRNGKYTPLPPIQSTGAAASPNGVGVFEVKNDTPYTLTALFSGPIERRVDVAPRGSLSIYLPAGSYKLVGQVNSPNVLPSYGEHVFDARSAGIEFYIQ